MKQINRIRNEQGTIATDTKEFQRTKRELKSYSTNLENLKKMNKFLDLAKPLRLSRNHQSKQPKRDLKL